MPVINVQSSLRLGVLSTYADIYKNRYPNYAKKQDRYIKRDTVKTRTAEYPLKESIPMPEFWGYNTPRHRKTIRDRYLTFNHYPFELTVTWNRFDEADEVIKDLKPHIESGVNRFLQLPDVMVSDYLENSTTLLPSLTLAFDGAALFSATNGDGGNRFGVSGGNILNGTGTSTAAMHHDLFAARQRFMEFKDTEGQPFFAPEEVELDKMCIVFPSQLIEPATVLQEAKSTYVNTAINTSQDNVLVKRFDTFPNQRLSTSSNDWYVFLNHEYLKVFLLVERESLNSQPEDETNSDYARDLGQRATLNYTRVGMAPFAPMAAIQINQ